VSGTPARSAAARLGQPGGGEIHAGDVEPVAGQVHGVGAGAAAQVDRAAGAQPAGLDQLDELVAGADLPGHPEEAVSDVVEEPRVHGW
jgi:hypothetical protein